MGLITTFSAVMGTWATNGGSAAFPKALRRHHQHGSVSSHCSKDQHRLQPYSVQRHLYNVTCTTPRWTYP